MERHGPYGANAPPWPSTSGICGKKLEIDPANPRYLKVLWATAIKWAPRQITDETCPQLPLQEVFIAVLLCVVCITLGTVSALAISQIARYGGLQSGPGQFCGQHAGGHRAEDIYKVSQYYSLLMNGLPWTERSDDYSDYFLPGRIPIFSSPSRITAPATSCCFAITRTRPAVPPPMSSTSPPQMVYNYYGYDGVSY